MPILFIFIFVMPNELLNLSNIHSHFGFPQVVKMVSKEITEIQMFSILRILWNFCTLSSMESCIPISRQISWEIFRNWTMSDRGEASWLKMSPLWTLQRGLTHFDEMIIILKCFNDQFVLLLGCWLMTILIAWFTSMLHGNIYVLTFLS